VIKQEATSAELNGHVAFSDMSSTQKRGPNVEAKLKACEVNTIRHNMRKFIMQSKNYK